MTVVGDEPSRPAQREAERAVHLSENFKAETIEHGKIILVLATRRCQVISEHETACATVHYQVLQTLERHLAPAGKSEEGRRFDQFNGGADALD